MVGRINYGANRMSRSLCLLPHVMVGPEMTVQLLEAILCKC
jgi:hypothetical protein